MQASAFAQQGPDAGTPDTLDTTQVAPFPVVPESRDSMTEQEMELIKSAWAGDTETLKALVAKGADINLTDKKKRTPLLFAASNGHTATVQYLLDQGADVNARDSDEQTALLYAAKRSFNETARLLIDKGAEVNAQSKKRGISALMLAAVWDNEDLAKMLLEHGADPALTDVFGRTATLLAEEKGHADMVALLKET